MISITIYRHDNQVVRVSSRGHAGFDEYGKDVVCAAVSMLFINTLNSLEVIAGDRYIDNEVSPGVIDRSFPDGLSHDGSILMESMIMGLTETGKQYGSDYVTIDFKEV
jgi:hypothetical protein